jgi:hypothetical protein
MGKANKKYRNSGNNKFSYCYVLNDIGFFHSILKNIEL